MPKNALFLLKNCKNRQEPPDLQPLAAVIFAPRPHWLQVAGTSGTAPKTNFWLGAW